MDDQRQRDEEPDHADPRYRIEAHAIARVGACGLLLSGEAV
jgi:hypothetical protein